ncbi:MAG: rRNA maturation RNase YbeY [Deltaproteobacteria bacterium]|jgi:probable rRNA maturation factor|nr:rRNA maturation RNase YbeY [Deltaproteobacteria bacterium]
MEAGDVTMVDVLVRPTVSRLLAPRLRRAIAARLRAAMRLLGRSRSQVALLFTDDDEIRELNRTYRKLDRATDVLSFHQRELRGETDPAGDGIFLGDIVISVETALRRGRGKRLPGELARLAIHGLCHLFGHDHQRAKPAAAMRKLENRLLRQSRARAR